MPPGNSPVELRNSATITFYLRNAPSVTARIEIAELSGGSRYHAELDVHQGINRSFWPLRFDPPAGAAAEPAAGGGGAGTYQVRLMVDGRTLETMVTAREDPALGKSGSDSIGK